MRHAASAPRPGDILVVDDDPMIVEMLLEFLHEDGFATRRAFNSTEALMAIADRQPALLLTDIAMPIMSGDELIAQLRARGHTFPMAVMTASPALIDSLEDTHPAACFLKPFDIDEVLAFVAQHVLRDIAIEINRDH